MKTLQEIRREYILQVLDRTNWDFRKASGILKVSEDFLKSEIQRIGRVRIKASPDK